MQHYSHISDLITSNPTKAQLCSCAQTANSSFPLQHVFVYRHLQWTLLHREVQDPPHRAVTSPLLPLPLSLFRLRQTCPSLPSFRLSSLGLKPAEDTLATLHQTDLAPPLKSSLLQNNRTYAEAKLLSGVIPVMPQALIHWRYPFLPKFFPLAGRNENTIRAPSHAILLITAGKNPDFFQSPLCCTLEQVMYVYSLTKSLGSNNKQTNKKL